MSHQPVAVLFVCLGNICRSPAAEGVLLHLAEKQGLDIHVESCGLGDWHEGQLPDPRIRKVAKTRGIILTSRAQPFNQSFFDRFDHILAADHSVRHELLKWAEKPEHKAKVHLITSFSPSYSMQEVPDPYYGGDAEFQLAMDMIEDACEGFIGHLRG